MKKLVKYLSAVLIAFLLFNCSKDDDEVTQPPQAESTRLTNYTIDGVPFNMTYNDDGTLFKYQYGNTFAVSATIEYNPNGDISKNGSRTFTYNLQGQIATITQNLSPTASFVSTMVYDSQGLVESITANHNNGQTGTIQINYNGNNKPVLISEYNESVAVSPHAKTTLTYDDFGNITQQFIERSNDGITYYDFSTTTYTYDTKKNPFALTIDKIGTSNNQLFQFFIGMNSVSFGRQVAFASLYFNSPNNLVAIQDSFKIITYNYTYNDDDYPITREEIYDDSSSGGSVYTYNSIFTYETY
tara:strand:+ start:38 stop:937 length:900 start_codon:yes stop_codon:yes gene_type:complete